jgi:hypothetical protein
VELHFQKRRNKIKFIHQSTERSCFFASCVTCFQSSLVNHEDEKIKKSENTVVVETMPQFLDMEVGFLSVKVETFKIVEISGYNSLEK